jgi:hypothetical protein
VDRYRFETTITVEGVRYAAGDEADASDIPAGSLVSLIRLRQVTLIPTAPIVAAATPAKAAGGKTK